MVAQAAPPPATGRQIARGAAWMMLFKLADKSVGLVSTLILARLLVPADFGLVAMAMAVVAFTQMMGAFGFDTALIQRQDARRAHYDTAWTFNVIFGAASAAVLLALALPMARFYDDARLTPILAVLALGAFAGGLENIGTVAFRKELDFRSEFRFLLYKRLVSFVVTVGLAFALRSHWALVAGVVTGRLASVWISYRLHPFRPRLSLAARGDLMGFSKWIFVSSLINFFHTRSTDFILGRTVGAHGLGVYNIGHEIASMPSTELIAPLNRALYPAYSRLNNDLPELRLRFLEVFGIICLVGFPVAAGLFTLADPAVRVVLGDKWLETIPIIRTFAFAGLLSALLSNLFLVVLALGRPQSITLVSGVQLVFALPAVIWGSLAYGIIGAAIAHLVVTTVAAAGILAFFTRITGIEMRAMARAGWRPLLCAIVMALGTMAIDQSLLQAWQQPVQLVRLVALGIGATGLYVGLLWSLWRVSGSPPGAEALVLRVIGERNAALWRPRTT